MEEAGSVRGRVRERGSQPVPSRLAGRRREGGRRGGGSQPVLQGEGDGTTAPVRLGGERRGLPHILLGAW